MTIFEGLVLGLVQGLAEWLPVSSEGVLVLVQLSFFEQSPDVALATALFLHLGTLLAVVVYFHKDLKKLVLELISKTATQSDRALVNFYIYTTLISVVVAGLGYWTLKQVDAAFLESYLTLAIGLLLLVTAFLLAYSRSEKRTEGDIDHRDAWWLGLTQGFAILPGISRSGSTMAVGLLRGLGYETALRVSFIMGIPLMLIGVVALYIEGGLASFGLPILIAILTSFFVGLATIKALLWLARKVNFAWIVGMFGVLVILFSLV